MWRQLYVVYLAFSSDSGHCFKELSHVTDCKEGIVK